MKRTLRIALILGAVFASTFLLNIAFGVLNADDVRNALNALAERPMWVVAAVVVVLALDSVLAVPTITTVLVGGYLLGATLGGIASSIGLMVAGSICYWGGRLGSRRFLGTGDNLKSVIQTIDTLGPAPLLLSRAAPILPEVLSALAGAGGMPATRYYLYYALGNIPFAFLASWAGSISTLQKPWAALAVGVGLPALGAVALTYRHVSRRGARSRVTAAYPVTGESR